MKIAIGTAQFGMKYGINNDFGKVSEFDVKKILNHSINNGIDTIDTAIAYGDSENVLGMTGVSDFKVISKLPKIPDENKINDLMHKMVNESLTRLNIQSLYALMLHAPHQILDKNGEEIISALQNLKQKGLINKIGISIYSVKELGPLLDIFKFDIIQCPFNLVDRSLDETGWLKKLKKLDIEVHTRSSFLQGLLVMPRKKIPEKFNKWNSLWELWHEWLKENNISAVSACVNFCLSNEYIDKVVFGVDSLDQLKEIIESSETLSVKSYPDIGSSSENLINPSKWSNL